MLLLTFVKLFLNDEIFFRYYDKRVNSLYEEGKRSYCEKRGMIYTPQNKKGIKLKDSLKYLEVRVLNNETEY